MRRAVTKHPRHSASALGAVRRIVVGLNANSHRLLTFAKFMTSATLAPTFPASGRGKLFLSRVRGEGRR